MSNPSTAGLVVVGADEGEARWVGASRITMKATAEQTNGGFGLVTSEVAQGTSPPLHIHHTADEAVWVLSGRIRVRCGDDEVVLEPGGFVFLPRGIPHTFLAEQDSVMLGLLSPGGTEAFYLDAGLPVTGSTPPPPDPARMERAAAQHACEFVGPPLNAHP
jgi:quercetin dioxygenase-like cupin family protein